MPFKRCIYYSKVKHLYHYKKLILLYLKSKYTLTSLLLRSIPFIMSKKVKYGAFSKVTIYDDNPMVDILTEDHAKEAMVLGWFPDHPLFPEVLYSYKPNVTYHMKKYDTKFIKANLDPDQWQLYQLIKKIYKEWLWLDSSKYTVPELGTLFESHRSLLGDDITDALIGASDAMGNYSYRVGFEISPRNCAVDNGKLILLDCFFNPEQLEQIRRSGKRRMYS